MKYVPVWIAASLGLAACQVSDAELAPRIPELYGSAGVGGSGDAGSTAAGGFAASAGSGGQDTTTAAAGSSGSGGGAAGYTGAAGEQASAGSGGSDSAQAGAGGSDSAQAGSGGSDSSQAGSGGSDSGQAGSGGSDSGQAGSGGSNADTCPAQYTMASHIVINVSWDGTYALTKGSGEVHVWTKTKFFDSGESATLESRSCGSVLPAITTTKLAGSEQILPEIPDAAWDAVDMPTFYGTATHVGDQLSVDPGVVLLGLSMGDPSAAWPAATDITGVDHDDDGPLGITAVAKEGDGFYAPPTDLLKNARADRLYLAIRNVMTLSATVSGCPDTYTGTANVSKFENHIIGCHVKGGSTCDSTQAKFVDDNRTVYNLGDATYTAKRVSDDATCADVRAALPL